VTDNIKQARTTVTHQSKSVCIMQPYFFPHVGYFQLANAVEEFWILDCVQYIRKGWMNRNKLLVSGSKLWFTLPVCKGSRSDLIWQKKLDDAVGATLNKLSRTMQNSYTRAPNLSSALRLLTGTRDFVNQNTGNLNFANIAEYALRETFKTLGLKTPLYRTTSLSLPKNLTGQARIIAACQRIGANRFINPIGGTSLYDSAAFKQCGIDLVFLKAGFSPYDQGCGNDFSPGLSILDLIAHQKGSEAKPHLEKYELY